MILNAQQLTEAREWIADCFEDVDAAELTHLEVERGIARHFEGGIAAFLAVIA